jgi:hypothetical protein
MLIVNLLLFPLIIYIVLSFSIILIFKTFKRKLYVVSLRLILLLSIFIIYMTSEYIDLLRNQNEEFFNIVAIILTVIYILLFILFLIGKFSS